MNVPGKIHDQSLNGNLVIFVDSRGGPDIRNPVVELPFQQDLGDIYAHWGHLVPGQDLQVRGRRPDQLSNPLPRIRSYLKDDKRGVWFMI